MLIIYLSVLDKLIFCDAFNEQLFHQELVNAEIADDSDKSVA